MSLIVSDQDCADIYEDDDFMSGSGAGHDAQFVFHDGNAAISETMEQVHKHFEKYLALNREVLDIQTLMKNAVTERWGQSASVANVLQCAEENSLAASRAKLISNPKTNGFVDTSAQGDLFDNVALKVPRMFMINGKATPYYEASILDGKEFWQATEATKNLEFDAYQKAAASTKDQIDVAKDQQKKIDEVIKRAMNANIDPRTVRYAQKQEA